VIVWLTRHAQTLFGTLGRLSQQRMQTGMTILVIGIALTLPACLQVLTKNVAALGDSFDRTIELSVYMRTDAAVAQAEQLAAQLRARPDFAEVRLIKADEGLAEFRARSGFGEALDALESNPLPHALVIRPVASFTGAKQLDALAGELKMLPGVESVQLDSVWVERFNAMLDALRSGSWVAAILLAIGVTVIIGNTIRADIHSRRAEIEIAKLVGASDAFVRRPFLYTGVWYGLGGALLALLLTALIVALLSVPIARLAGLYGGAYSLSGLGLDGSFKLLALGVGLGWVGSLVAANWQLRQVEPS